MTPITGGFANKTQNFEAVAQYQFDFGLRPSLGYVLSKGKDIEGIGDEDLVNYIDVGATGSDSNLLIVFYVQIMPDDLVMQLHRF